MAKKDLVVIGTARKPNPSDLRNRRLSGLPDPDPDVALRRTQFESEQVALRKQVSLIHGEDSVSFLRTKIDAWQSTDGAAGEEREMVGNAVSEDSVGEIDEESVVGDGQMPKSTAYVDVGNLSGSSVANEACETRKAVRNLRNRNPVQLNPYALEREMYRRRVKAGRVE